MDYYNYKRAHQGVERYTPRISIIQLHSSFYISGQEIGNIIYI